MNHQSGQALVEWAVAAMVLLLFAFAILAVGQVVGQYMAVRSAASQAAFAAARAPSGHAAEVTGRSAAHEALRSGVLRDVQITIDTHGFQRGGTVTAAVSGCVSLAAYPIVVQSFGPCLPVHWTAHALIEPYRSRTP